MNPLSEPDGQSQSHEERQSGKDCLLCQGLIVRIHPNLENHSLRKYATMAFHDQCDNCEARRSYPKAACSFCKHLRLGHLLRCILPRLEDIHGVTSIRLAANFDSNPRLGDDCHLCRLFQHVLDKGKDPVQYISIYNYKSPRSRLEEAEYYIQLGGHQGAVKLVDVELTERTSSMRYTQLTEQVDWTVVNGWEILSRKEVSTLPAGFRVIDLTQHCLVKPSYPCDYATLSYVWGAPIEGHGELQATRSNIESLEKAGSLSISRLPATITDAMAACRQLGFEYLWVDRLCIVQDDENREYNKYGQIDSMDHIYASSRLTIVAASGASARDGLSGITRPRVYRRKILAWEGVLLSSPVPHLDEILAETTWASRGWTFQERICASNTMFFTDYGVFAVLLRNNKVGIHLRLERGLEDWARPQTDPDYFEGAREYTQRSLTLHTDILYAFTGAARLLRCGQDIRFGLPLRLFDDAILWQPGEWNMEARPPHNSGRQIFPSWAWCSLHGPITYGSAGRKSPFGIIASLASWAFPPPSGARDPEGLVPVPFAPAVMGYPDDSSGVSTVRDLMIERQMATMKFAWREGYFKRKYFVVGPVDQDQDPFLHRTYLAKNLLSHTMMKGIQHSRNPDPAFLSAFSFEDRLKACACPGRVLVFTQRASLGLEYIATSSLKRMFLLRSHNGRWMGVIWLTQSTADTYLSAICRGGWLHMEFLALSITLDYDMIFWTAKELNIRTRKRDDGTWEPQTREDPEEESIYAWEDRVVVHTSDLLPLEDMEIGKLDSHKDGIDQWEAHGAEVNFVSHKGRPFNDPPHWGDDRTPPRINVMLISQQDGVARRLGIGQVYLKRWKDANPQFCTTVLE